MIKGSKGVHPCVRLCHYFSESFILVRTMEDTSSGAITLSSPLTYKFGNCINVTLPTKETKMSSTSTCSSVLKVVLPIKAGYDFLLWSQQHEKVHGFFHNRFFVTNYIIKICAANGRAVKLRNGVRAGNTCIWVRFLPTQGGLYGKYHLSQEKKPLTFHYTGCLIGILTMVYYSLHITG